jgi:hypothetical protein
MIDDTLFYFKGLLLEISDQFIPLSALVYSDH